MRSEPQVFSPCNFPCLPKCRAWADGDAALRPHVCTGMHFCVFVPQNESIHSHPLLCDLAFLLLAHFLLADVPRVSLCNVGNRCSLKSQSWTSLSASPSHTLPPPSPPIPSSPTLVRGTWLVSPVSSLPHWEDRHIPWPPSIHLPPSCHTRTHTLTNTHYPPARHPCLVPAS